MKHLLILLTSIMSINYLFAGTQYNACRAGYNLRGVGRYTSGLYYRPGIDLKAMKKGKENYSDKDDQDAFEWGYFYAGCSDQDGGLGAHRSGEWTGWFADCDHGVLGQVNDVSCGGDWVKWGWKVEVGCEPEATHGDGKVCGDKFSIK